MNLMHLGFLAAGAAAMSLPLWIHLLLRQKAIAMEIGSIRFVKQVVRRTKSRQRIQRWILLALRALAVLLLGLLFARPFFPQTPADGSTREVVVLIDRSASMSVRSAGGTSAIQLAIQRAKAFLDSLGSKVHVHVGLFDAGGVEPVSLADLDAISPSAMATRYDDAFAWATDLLAASQRSDQGLMLLSDLQSIAAPSVDVSAFPTDVPIRIENPAPAIAQNVAIESVTATQVELRPGVPVSVDVQLVNHGAFPLVDAELEIKLDGPDGTIANVRPLALDAGQRQSIRLELPINSPGVYQGIVSVDHDDPMHWDNQRALAFEARFPDRLLLIDGDAGAHPWENETYFVETALRLKTAVGDGPPRTFEVERLVWDRGSGFPDLAGFRLIVITNVGRFTDRDAERLKAFVQSGGNALWFPGDRSADVVHDSIVAAGLLGKATLGRPTDGVATVTEFDSSHPALGPFADPQHGDLRSLTANRVLPIKSVDPKSTVLLRGRRWPLAVSHSVGKGRFVLIATSADRSWNDWPQNRLFVPLMRQLAAWLTGQLEDLQRVETHPIDHPDQIPGIRMESGSLVVRNVDPAESQLNRYEIDEFRQVLGLPEHVVKTDEEDRRQQYAPDGVARSDEKWPWVVWMLIGILSSELLLASRVHE
ncbi:BatA domain-containing protein [Rhodopirellula sp. JC639]|uniref:BatA domain-containing protein n=1 Tax=Stieleria mannarensis TaxID=2755585 RepID=UPI001603D430|nr:BatA domain-containing protein [Rhodopirellula sp. JC639]